MKSCELVTLISSLACIISKDRTNDEISILGAFFTQLGDTLTTISLVPDNCNCNSNNNDDTSDNSGKESKNNIIDSYSSGDDNYTKNNISTD